MSDDTQNPAETRHPRHRRDDVAVDAVIDPEEFGDVPDTGLAG